MIVKSLTVGFWVPAFVIVVAPIKVIPFVIVRTEVQSALPAGTTTMSPSEAEETAEVTSAREGLAALMTEPFVCATIVRNAPPMITRAFRTGRGGKTTGVG